MTNQTPFAVLEQIVQQVSPKRVPSDIGVKQASSMLLAYQTGEIHYLTPVEKCIEVINRVALTAVPGSPAWLKGMFPWRGDICSVMDLQLYLNNTSEIIQPRKKIILVRYKQELLGILVDVVNGIKKVPLQPPKAENIKTKKALCQHHMQLEGQAYIYLDLTALVKLALTQENIVNVG